MEFKHIEGKGKPIKVVAPVNGTTISKGKEYTVTEYFDIEDNDTRGAGFYITDDIGERRVCREFADAHLNSKNWIVTEREQP